jgi:hypothetical protein
MTDLTADLANLTLSGTTDPIPEETTEPDYAVVVRLASGVTVDIRSGSGHTVLALTDAAGTAVTTDLTWMESSRVRMALHQAQD